MSCSICQGYDDTKCPCCGEEVRMVECPDCKGTGKTPYLAYDMRTSKTIEVEEIVWLTLPEDRQEAEQRRKHTYQLDEGGYRCPTCYGEGIIPEDH